MGTSQTSLEKLNYRGLDLEKTSPLRSRRKFFLDIPFDRTSLRTFSAEIDCPREKKRLCLRRKSHRRLEDYHASKEQTATADAICYGIPSEGRTSIGIEGCTQEAS